MPSALSLASAALRSRPTTLGTCSYWPETWYQVAQPITMAAIRPRAIRTNRPVTKYMIRSRTGTGSSGGNTGGPWNTLVWPFIGCVAGGGTDRTEVALSGEGGGGAVPPCAGNGSEPSLT